MEELYVAGGADDLQIILNSIELYNTTTKLWTLQEIYLKINMQQTPSS